MKIKLPNKLIVVNRVKVKQYRVLYRDSISILLISKMNFGVTSVRDRYHWKIAGIWHRLYSTER